MSDLDALYQDVLLSHARKPRHFGALDGADRRAVADNPVCGDRVEVFAVVRDGRIERVSFEGTGCAISMASASLLTEAVEGKTDAQVAEIAARLERVLRGEDEGRDLGDLAALAGVARFPVRAACARLAWEALARAMGGGPR